MNTCRQLRVQVALAVILCACTGRPPPERVLRPVRAAIAEFSVCSAGSRFSGSIEPLARLDLAFKRAGYVSSILQTLVASKSHPVGQGDAVHRGAVLARLRDADYRVKLVQAKAQLAQAQVERNQARQDHNRAKQLFAHGSMPQGAFEGSEARALAAEAHVQAATALVTETQLALDDCALRAPSDAVLWKRLVEVGSLVGPGTPGFVLADTTTMKVVFGVPDVLLESVRVGASLQVSVEALGTEPTEGRVTSVAPVADPKSRLFDVEMLLPNPDGRLRAGMIASLQVLAKAPQTALAVPLRAVVRQPGRTSGFAVFVVEGNVLRLRQIRPGEFCASLIEVSSGLRAGERVVVEGAARAFDGERVALSP